MTTDDIKRIYSMADILGMYGIKPDRAGFIRCPFHEEKTASCKIYPKSYHCFGCGAGGDIFSFVERMEGITFKEAFLKLGGKFEKMNDSSARKIARHKSVDKTKRKKYDRASQEYYDACDALIFRKHMLLVLDPDGPDWKRMVIEVDHLNNKIPYLAEQMEKYV